MLGKSLKKCVNLFIYLLAFIVNTNEVMLVRKFNQQQPCTHFIILTKMADNCK